MALSGVARKVTRLLPTLLQLIVVIAVLHLVAQGSLVRMKRSLQNALTEPRGKGSFKNHSGGQNWNRNGIHKHKKQALHQHGQPHPHKQPARARHPPQPKKRRPPISRVLPSSTSSTTTTPKPLPPVEEIHQDMERRIEILNATCSKWRLGLWKDGKESEVKEEEIRSSLPINPLYQALLVSREKHLTFCPIPKAGNNWISKRLLDLTGQFKPNQLEHLQQPASVLARHRYPFLPSWDLYPEVLGMSTNIIVVRHPFDRLLAYYKTSLENAKTHPNEFIMFGKRIAAKYRKTPVARKEPRFGEFIHFLLDLDIKSLDDSWQPITRRCTPCHIPFNVIGHYETLWRDTYYAWQRAGLTFKMNNYPENKMTPEIRRQYFSELTLNDMIKLHQKYKLDFELFGYTLEEHLSYAASSDESFDPHLLAALPRADTSYLLKATLEEVSNGREQLNENDENERQEPSVLETEEGDNEDGQDDGDEEDQTEENVYGNEDYETTEANDY